MTRPYGKPWPAALCRSVWEWVRDNRNQSGGMWVGWQGGHIITAEPRRAVTCAACGQRIAKGVPALYAWASPLNLYTASRRYLHREPCI